MEDKLSDRSFVIVAHRVFPSIVDDLKRYLLRHRVRSLSYVIHEFMNLPSRRSFIERYRSGEPVGTHYAFDYRFLPEPLVNVKDFLYTLFWLARMRENAVALARELDWNRIFSENLGRLL